MNLQLLSYNKEGEILTFNVDGKEYQYNLPIFFYQKLKTVKNFSSGKAMDYIKKHGKPLQAINDDLSAKIFRAGVVSNNVINNRSGNFMKPKGYINGKIVSLDQEIDQIVEEFINEIKENDMNYGANALNVQENNDTTLQPEKSSEREKKVNISGTDVQMFLNIKRDTDTIGNLVSQLASDIKTNNGENYDNIVLKVKRAFEPLVVTIQRLPDHKDDLEAGNGEDTKIEQPAPDSEETGIDSSNSDMDTDQNKVSQDNIASGETELDKNMRKQADGQEEETPKDNMKNLKKNTLKENEEKPAKQYLSRTLTCGNCGGSVSEKEGNKGVALANILDDLKNIKGYLCKKCAIEEFGQEEYDKVINKNNELDETSVDTNLETIDEWIKNNSHEMSQLESKKYQILADTPCTKCKQRMGDHYVYESKRVCPSSLNEARKHSKTEKIALKNKNGRTIWVLRKQANKYLSKGYHVASSASKKDKKGKGSSKPKKVKRSVGRVFEDFGAGQSMSNIMGRDKQELMDNREDILNGIKNKFTKNTVKGDQQIQYGHCPGCGEQADFTPYYDQAKGEFKCPKCGHSGKDTDFDFASFGKDKPVDEHCKDSERMIMVSPDGKKYAVKKGSTERYIDKGYKLDKQGTEGYPKHLEVDESHIEKVYEIAKKGIDEVITSIAKSIVKDEIKKINGAK